MFPHEKNKDGNAEVAIGWNINANSPTAQVRGLIFRFNLTVLVLG